MIETDFEKRHEAYRRRESERDGLIQKVFENYGTRLGIVAERSVPGAGNGLGPFDAQYIVRDTRRQELFVVIDRATIGLRNLEDGVRRQLEGRLGLGNTTAGECQEAG